MHAACSVEAGLDLAVTSSKRRRILGAGRRVWHVLELGGYTKKALVAYACTDYIEDKRNISKWSTKADIERPNVEALVVVVVVHLQSPGKATRQP